MTELLIEFEDKIKKQIASYEHELAAIRVGRANPAVLDKVHVDYYGTPTPINQMAEVRIPDARTIVINPWDASTLKAIEKAINVSDLGMPPNNDGKSIRLSFPPLTEERRKELIKQVAKMSEDAKVRIRNIRREANDKLKEMKKKSEITEDDLKNAEKKTQEFTDKYIKDIDSITAKKDKEMMEI